MGALLLGATAAQGAAPLVQGEAEITAGPGAARGQDEAPDRAESLAENWTRNFATFRDPKAPGAERLDAILRAYEHCYAWILAHPAPFEAGELDDVRVLRQAMARGERLADGYLDRDFVAEVHRAWFESLRAHCADGASETMFAEELAGRVRFVLRHGSLAEVEGLLTDEALARIERVGAGGRRSGQRILRADARRTRGAFREALEDLEVARVRLAEPGDPGGAVGRGAYEAVAFKLAIDLGLLDRASTSLGNLRQLAAGEPAESFAGQRFQLALARYHQANGQFERVVQAAEEMLPEGIDIGNLQVGLKDTQARALVLRAIALSKLARTPAERRGAIRAIRLESERAGTDEASQVPLDIELAEALIQGGRPGDRAEAYAIVEALLARLEAGTSSALFTARAAAQLYSLTGRVGSAGEVERSRLILENSAAQLVRSWRDIGRLDGGIGFLDFPERLAVASTWVGSRLDSPGGAAYALGALLEMDRCSQLSRRLAERLPDSPALKASAESLVALAGKHQGVLVWFLPGPDRTHRFTVGPSGVEYAALEPLARFEGPVRRVGQWLRRRPEPGEPAAPEGEVLGDLRWLAARLLPPPFTPTREKAPSRGPTRPLPGLWLTGLDLFGNAPFEALPCAAGPFVGLETSVVRMPSVTCAIHGALTGPGAGLDDRKGTFAIFSPPMKDHPGGDISLRIDELERLREASRGHARFSLTRGPAGTREGFAAAILSGAELFVAWTHGRYDFGLDRPAGLAAAKPEGPGFDFLDAGFMERVLDGAGPQGVPRTAYLAACDVARGHRRIGDAGASHLAGALLGAGVPAVVASGERNDRDATSAHLGAFSRAYLGDGHDAGRAMLVARREVAARPQFAHPHFWAGLQLLGWGPTSRR